MATLLKLYAAPAEEPVTLGEAKAHLRIEHDSDDDKLNALIQAARQWAEEYLWRGIVTQTWEATLDAFPDSGVIELAKGHLGSVTHVKYLDTNGVEQTLSTALYTADGLSVPPKIRLTYGESWPTTRDVWNAVTVRYVVGWAVADVPEPIRQGILLLVSEMYEHRTPTTYGQISQLPFAFRALLAPYQLRRF